MSWKKPMGLVLYLLGIGLGIARPPLERLACMAIPSGKVLTRVNVPLLTVELALIMLGSLLIGLSHDFKNTHRLNGWLAVSSGLGTAIIAGYAGIESLFLFGVVLATLGLVVYNLGRVTYGDGGGN
ncbi:hypothetical protein [Thermococcus sp.]|uniref:hypothetical protein n=1 Tax=Thermococcus sp. TaxID=35749 RepID=UPI0026236637|nr:hypothetical protein [Thermococcus sp.]